MSLILENFEDEKALTVDEILQTVYSEPQFCEWGVSRESLRARLDDLESLSYRSVFDSIISGYLKVRGEISPELVVVKGPRLDIHLKSLISIYETPYFINLIRDGRAVYNSKLDMVSVTGMKMSNNIFQASLDWKKKFRRLADQPLITIRFEDLVVNTAQIIDQLFDVIGISTGGREITGGQQDYHKLIGKKQIHLHTNVKSAPDKSITVKWMNSLSDEEIWVYEQICRKDLVENGYELVSNKDVIRSSVLCLLVRHAAHWIWLKARNIFYYTFVDRSLIQKIKGKRFE